MPVESKVGLVLGVVVTIVLAICFHSKEHVTVAEQPVVQGKPSAAVQGLPTSQRK